MAAHATSVLQVAVDPVVFAVVAGVGVGLAALLGPPLARSLRESRPPRATEAERLDRLLGVAGYEPAGVDVVDGDGNSVTVSIRGLPGRRRLVVTDAVLADLDEDTAGALLAAEAERARHHYAAYRALAAALVVGLSVAVFGGRVAFSEGLFGLAIAALALFWVGRQLQFRADRAAAKRVGSAALADAFEAVAAIRGVDPEPASPRTWVEVQPPLGQRIDRLRAAAEE